MRVVVATLALVACSSGAPRPTDDHGAGSAAIATPPAPKPPPPAPIGPYRATAGDFAKGDVQVRVEWQDVPLAARAPGPRTACGTEAAPAVAPTTTWGIPDAIVAIDVDHGKPAGDPDAHVVVASCALSPRVAIAGAAITVESHADAPSQLAIARAGTASPLVAADGSGSVVIASPANAGRAAPPEAVRRMIDLPIAGHAVSAALAGNALYEISGSAVEPAWIATPAQPYAAVTEASGQVVLRDVPVGSYTVEALVPPRAGQPARTGHATVAVTANALAEVTVSIAP